MTQAPQAILDLVERFGRNIGQYRSPSYNETQAAASGLMRPCKDLLQRQIDATDHQIDHLMYELCGLADEEIRIVETAPR